MNNFPNFTDIGGRSSFTNIRPPNSLVGIGNELSLIDIQEKKKAITTYQCYFYPRIDLVEIPNEKYKVDTLINGLPPVTGDMMWGINPQFLQNTYYKYQGFNLIQVNNMLNYEAEISIAYLADKFKDEDVTTKITDVLVTHYGGKTIRSLLLDHNLTIQNKDQMKNISLLPVELFLRYCKEKKIIEKWLAKELKGKEEQWESFVENEGFAEDLNELDIQLLSCFSLVSTSEKYQYLGVCINRFDIYNEYSIPFRRFKVQYIGYPLTYLLAPNIRKNTKFSEYFYRIGIKPVQLFVYDTYTKIKNLKNDIKIDNKDTVGGNVNIKRCEYLGEVKSSNIEVGYKRSFYYKIQGFPHKEINYENINEELRYKMMHSKEKRKIFTKNI